MHVHCANSSVSVAANKDAFIAMRSRSMRRCSYLKQKVRKDPLTGYAAAFLIPSCIFVRSFVSLIYHFQFDALPFFGGSSHEI
jgi:hypothetical protein